MSVKRSKSKLSFPLKEVIIKTYEDNPGMRKKELADLFHIPESTLRGILRNRDAILVARQRSRMMDRMFNIIQNNFSEGTSSSTGTSDLSQPIVSSDESFMDNQSSARKIKEEPPFDEEKEYPEEEEEEVLSTRSSTPEPSTSHRELQNPKKRRKIRDEYGEALMTFAEDQELTPDDHFTNYVNSTLKSFENNKHKEQCKAAISNILTEYLFIEE